jgi:hypothetical protein
MYDNILKQVKPLEIQSMMHQPENIPGLHNTSVGMETYQVPHYPSFSPFLLLSPDQY